jgi:hypothetical protein
MQKRPVVRRETEIEKPSRKASMLRRSRDLAMATVCGAIEAEALRAGFPRMRANDRRNDGRRGSRRFWGYEPGFYEGEK